MARAVALAVLVELRLADDLLGLDKVPVLHAQHGERGQGSHPGSTLRLGPGAQTPHLLLAHNLKVVHVLLGRRPPLPRPAHPVVRSTHYRIVQTHHLQRLGRIRRPVTPQPVRVKHHPLHRIVAVHIPALQQIPTLANIPILLPLPLGCHTVSNSSPMRPQTRKECLLCQLVWLVASGCCMSVWLCGNGEEQGRRRLCQVDSYSVFVFAFHVHPIL